MRLKIDGINSRQQNIKRTLREAGISQASLAKWLSIDPSDLSKRLNGRRRLTPRLLEAIRRNLSSHATRELPANRDGAIS